MAACLYLVLITQTALNGDVERLRTSGRLVTNWKRKGILESICYNRLQVRAA